MAGYSRNFNKSKIILIEPVAIMEIVRAYCIRPHTDAGFSRAYAIRPYTGINKNINLKLKV